MLENALMVGPAALQLMLDLGAGRNAELEADATRPSVRPLQRALAFESYTKSDELAQLLIAAGASASV
jgi:hypothetical protein